MKFSSVPSLLAAAAPLAASLARATPLTEVNGESSNLDRRIVTSAPHWVAYWGEYIVEFSMSWRWLFRMFD